MTDADPTRVIVWCEHVADRDDPEVRIVYPEGMHEAIAAGLREQLGAAADVRTATLHDADQGLGDDTLAAADVLVWWGHRAHDAVDDERAAAVAGAVLAGMGLIVLHSSHWSKPFRRLMGTSCDLRWREEPTEEVVWGVDPAHPIAAGLPPVFVVPGEEVYCERFDIPAPDELVFVSGFPGGETFRSGCCFRRGAGRVFYFGPGHETSPIYRQPEVLTVLANAVGWARNPARPRLRPDPWQPSPSGWFRGDARR
jgi:trehalose utilization protein